MKNIIFLIATALLSVQAFANEETVSAHYAIAKQNCHDIACIRIEIDQINHQILKLLAKRTAYVKRAGDLKSRTTKIADDRQRVAAQEKIVIERSQELELPLEIAIPTFREITENSIRFQQAHIDRMP
ncbi:MAG TPA: chorismate mutase [Rhabdochlamydiaceae bacterium]|nr:chorismate mutase [Rhabdochlamydiaceae bacterium]